jgi:hypothetical protein
MNPLTRTSSYPKVAAASGALLGDGFVPERKLREWVSSGLASRESCLLTLDDGRTFVLSDALRILGRRNGDSDPYGYTGRVFVLRELLSQGALLTADGVRIGTTVYDSELGVLAEATRASTLPPPAVQRRA